MDYKVSVIVPVYNVEKYIERCVESLMKQTLKEVEFIFVDDCSPDGSISVLEKTLERFPERSAEVKIIHNEVNKGLPVARMAGLDAAEGKYIIHIDSDDWIDFTTLEEMYGQAESTGAEICFCAVQAEFPSQSVTLRRDFSFDRGPSVVLGEYIACNWTNLGGMLVSRALYERSGARSAADITYFEDYYLGFQLLDAAERITFSEKAIYHYDQSNTGSITHTINERLRKQELECFERVAGMLKTEGKYEMYFKQIQWRFLKWKCSLVLHNRFDEFRNLHPESNRYIFSSPSPFCPRKAKLMMALTVLHLDFICRLSNRLHGRTD